LAWTSGEIARALTPALKDAGLPTTISFHNYGSHMRDEYRSYEAIEAALAAAGGTVYGLRIYLPSTLVGIAVDRLVAAIDRRVRTWRRQSGNTTVQVPIYGPDGKTVIHTVDVEDPHRPIAP
jgi:hypothetical protein